jgi:FixJ family two-component response regulator
MSARKTVHIVDDDADIRRALERMLSLHGYSPYSFSSATDYRNRARPEEAVCLILDIQLDGESGIDLKRELTNTHPGLPVILITGIDTERNRKAVQDLGAAGYLSKPFGSKVLLDAIEAANGPERDPL